MFPRKNPDQSNGTIGPTAKSPWIIDRTARSPERQRKQTRSAIVSPMVQVGGSYDRTSSTAQVVPQDKQGRSSFVDIVENVPFKAADWFIDCYPVADGIPNRNVFAFY
jgi:hypothetical protein